jgi:hypothetical protein
VVPPVNTSLERISGCGPNDIWAVRWIPDGFGAGTILHYSP